MYITISLLNVNLSLFKPLINLIPYQPSTSFSIRNFSYQLSTLQMLQGSKTPNTISFPLNNFYVGHKCQEQFNATAAVKCYY